MKTTPFVSLAQWMSRLARRVVALLLPALVMAAACTTAAADGSVTFDAALRSFDDRAWGPVDHQLAAGLRIEYARPNWPVRLFFGLHESEREETERVFVPDGGVSCFLIFCGASGHHVSQTALRAGFTDMTLGVVKAWGGDRSRVRPYIGGGVALVRADLEDRRAGFHDRDRSPGLWTHAGIVGVHRAYPSRVHFTFGFEVSALKGTRLDLGRARVNADYVQAGLISGLGW